MSVTNIARGKASFQEVDQFYRTARTAIRSIAWVVVAWFGFGALEKFAGESTDVSLAMSFILNALVDFKFSFSIALTGAACAWGAIERSLRLRKVEQMQARIIELETAIDPNRSSSGLTPQGKTNPRDRSGA